VRRIISKNKRNPENGSRPPFEIETVRSYDEWLSYSASMQSVFLSRRGVETDLIVTEEPFYIDGYCWVCKSPSRFKVDYLYSEIVDGRKMPNWRERLVCESCRLSNRLRASIHIFEYLFAVNPDSTIFITEQLTPMYRYLKQHYRNTIGSEYLGSDIPHGEIRHDGLRNEDLTSLSFESNMMDFILSFDCFEHIPDYINVFTECYRVLKPKGNMIFSVPFGLNSETNLVRAKVTDDGTIEHLLSPEYHGNPVDPSGGSLCFQYFGWEMLQQLKSAGFSEAYSLLVWSLPYAYLGGFQVYFMACK